MLKPVETRDESARFQRFKRTYEKLLSSFASKSNLLIYISGVKCTDINAPGLGFTCDRCPQGYQGNGTHCDICSMGVSIAASSAVAGAVPRGRDTRIIAAVQLMAPACSNDDGMGSHSSIFWLNQSR